MKIIEQAKFSKRNDLAFDTSTALEARTEGWRQQSSYRPSEVNEQEFHTDKNSPWQAVAVGNRINQQDQNQSPTPIYTSQGAGAEEVSRISTSTTKQSPNIHNFEQNLVEVKATKRSSASPANGISVEMQKELLLKSKAACKQLTRTFRVNLPGSTSKVPAVVQRSSTVRRPMPHGRYEVTSFIKPQIFDLVREQTKDQTREHLKFLNPREQEIFEQDRQIPHQALAPHIEHYQDYPVDHASGPETNIPQTFGATPRFPEVRCYYAGQAKKLSILDYHQQVFVNANTAPHIGKYTRRPEHFLTRSQERQLRAEAAEEAARAQRRQQLRTANDKDTKDREKQPGPDLRTGARQHDGQHSITFAYGAHIDALAGRPQIKEMINRIRYEARPKAEEKEKEENGIF